MNASLVSPASWRCRICGVSNPLHSRTCKSSDCSGERVQLDKSSLQKALAGGMLAQVLNPNAETVHNYVYNFGSEAPVTIVNPHSENEDPDTGPTQPSRPRRSFSHYFWRTVAYVCVTIMTLTLVMLFAVIVAGFMKAMRIL